MNQKEDIEMNDDELKKELEKLKKGNFLYLSEWSAGNGKGSYSGYLVCFTDKSLYEFESIGTFNTTFETHANINKLLTISDESEDKLVDFIKNEKLFYFDKVEKLVMDYGTTVEVSMNNIHSEVINADSMCSQGRFFIYNHLLEIIKDIIKCDKA